MGKKHTTETDEKDINISVGIDSEQLDVEVLPSETEKLKAELEESKLLAADYLDKLKRSMAEFDNFRKRTLKEKAEIYDHGVSDMAEKLLPVVDNFELAVASCENTEDKLFKGVDMILRQLKSVMLELGIEEIPALGEQFDPNLHNAYAHVNDENLGENEVVEQMRKGYILKGKVLRHSMVKVAN